MTIVDWLLRVGVWTVDALHLTTGCHLLNVAQICVSTQR